LEKNKTWEKSILGVLHREKSLGKTTLGKNSVGKNVLGKVMGNRISNSISTAICGKFTVLPYAEREDSSGGGGRRRASLANCCKCKNADRENAD